MAVLNRSLEVKTPPTSQSVSRTEAKQQCRISDDIIGHDEELRRLIMTATAVVESDTNTAIEPQTLVQRMDCFPPLPQRFIEVMRGQMTGVVSINYTDTEGNPQAFSDYVADVHRIPGAIFLAPSQDSWPGTQQFAPNAVEIEYTAGSGANHIQRQAILYLVDQYFVHKDCVTDKTMRESDLTYTRLINTLLPGDWPSP